MTVNPASTPAIRTHSGRYVDLEWPDPDDIALEDVAYALARINRWTGHADPPVSVAQHSVYVSEICPIPLRRWALLHDASEAYLTDVSGPLKGLLRGVSDLPQDAQHEIRKRLGPALWSLLCDALPGYRALQFRWDNAVSARFGVAPERVKPWDCAALLAERRDCGLADGTLWTEDLQGVVPCPVPVVPVCSEAAEALFLARAAELGLR